MNIKKIEEMDHYEILNLERTATQQEIENAYLLGIATYNPHSLAPYGLISEEERNLIMAKFEEAYQTLSDQEKRKNYDLQMSEGFFPYSQKASFRKSDSKLEIEDAETHKKVWDKIKSLLFRPKKESPLTVSKGEKSEPSASFTRGPVSFYRGEYLRRVRENRNLSLEEISQKCKISLAVLKALEEENFKSMPIGINISKLIETYARCLGLHPQNK
jgi:DnaJ-class molecular chaperone